MRSCSQGQRRSVDRGTCGPGIQPRKNISKADAEQFRAELTERMRKFNLALHPEKTRLLEFGPFAIQNRRRREEGKPETFNFLGFTHICVKKRSNGMYTVLRQTIRKRLQAKLNAVNTGGAHAPPLATTCPVRGWVRACAAEVRHPYPLRRMGVIT